MLESLGEPIMSSTMLLPDEDVPLTTAHDIDEKIGKHVDLIVDAGPAGIEPTTVIDLSEGTIDILRRGLGDTSTLE